MDIVIKFISSLILTVILSSYIGEWEKKIILQTIKFLPINNKITKKPNKITKTHYKNVQAYNPVHIAQLVRKESLEIINQADINNEKKKKIIEVSEWFIKNGVNKKYNDFDYKLWYYDFDYDKLNLKAPWLSAMAQGQIIEVFLAAFEITAKKKYLKEAKLAANSLYVPVGMGGVARFIDDGIWFEEYASINARPFFTLNGHNFALNGVWYLSKYDKKYTDLFKKGVKALEILVPQFDAKIWSKYDLNGIPANHKYHQIHIDQLCDMFLRTDNIIFKKYADKFKLYKFLPFSSLYRLVNYPNNFLILKYVINFSLSCIIFFR